MTIAYVVTSKGNDVHGDMAFVSMMSARITNPGWRIVLICDRKTMDAATGCKHRMLEVCDEVVAVDAPEGDPTFVNRWMKTQAIRWVSDVCLLLDTDTLIRRPLDDLPNLVEHLGAVPNYNTDTTSEQISDEDKQELQSMGWTIDFAFYANGGALLFKTTDIAWEFFTVWHKLYVQSVQLLQRNRDQPSLNTAILKTSSPVTRLPDSMNFQLRHITKGWSEAKVWHYYASIEMRNTLFADIIKQVAELTDTELTTAISNAISAKHPFIAKDDVSIEIARLSNHDGVLPEVWKSWLQTESVDQRSDLLKHLGYAQNSLTKTQYELRDVRSELSSLHRSISWQITKPARVLDHFLRSVLRKRE